MMSCAFTVFTVSRRVLRAVGGQFDAPRLSAAYSSAVALIRCAPLSHANAPLRFDDCGRYLLLVLLVEELVDDALNVRAIKQAIAIEIAQRPAGGVDG